jgi:hypothetical protein
VTSTPCGQAGGRPGAMVREQATPARQQSPRRKRGMTLAVRRSVFPAGGRRLGSVLQVAYIRLA